MNYIHFFTTIIIYKSYINTINIVKNEIIYNCNKKALC